MLIECMAVDLQQCSIKFVSNKISMLQGQEMIHGSAFYLNLVNCSLHSIGVKFCLDIHT